MGIPNVKNNDRRNTCQNKPDVIIRQRSKPEVALAALKGDRTMAELKASSGVDTISERPQETAHNCSSLD